MIAMENPRIIVIRRDNIGDLVCTTPMFLALRKRFPRSHIAALVNTYNRDVLEGHPAIDAVHAYEKAKHRSVGRSLFATYLARWGLFRDLRSQQFDYAILAGPGYQLHSLQLAWMAGVSHVIGFVTPARNSGIDLAVPYENGLGMHEVEDIFRLLHPLGIAGPPPATHVSVRADELARVRRALEKLKSPGPLITLHLSARKPSQRWPVEQFVMLGRLLADRYNARLLMLWSPGDASNPHHPGDDAKAASVVARLDDLDCLLYPTKTLASLLGALSTGDIFVGADGGAMHLAAALGKPVVALFGDSSPARWRPWGVASEILQASSRDVSDISVDDVADAVGRLLYRSVP